MPSTNNPADNPPYYLERLPWSMCFKAETASNPFFTALAGLLRSTKGRGERIHTSEIWNASEKLKAARYELEASNA